MFEIRSFLSEEALKNLRGGAGVVKRAALKRLWLSAYAGSNPVSRILNEMKNVAER